MNDALQTALTSYIAHIQADYAAYYDRCVKNGDTNPEFAARQIKLFNESFRVDVGAAYAKVVKDGSVHSFIVLKEGQFKVGDILKPAGWKAPAKNFARGNLLVGDFSRITWTGAH